MAPQPTIQTNGGTVTQTRRRRGVKRGRRTTARSGAATGGMAPTLGSSPLSVTNYDNLSAHIRGVCEGFALANNITSQQAFAGLKKSINW
jgi:hypothetical protein